MLVQQTSFETDYTCSYTFIHTELQQDTMLHNSLPDLTSPITTTPTSPARSPVPSPRPRSKPTTHTSTSTTSTSPAPSPPLPPKPTRQPEASREEETSPMLEEGTSPMLEEVPISLHDFVTKYSTLLPLQMKVKKGYHGDDERHSIATDDVYNVHFVKRTKVVVLEDRRGVTFNVPLNSAVQFAPLFHSSNDSKEATQGLSFEKVSDVMTHKPLPRVIRAMKSHVRVDPKATIEQSELFIVQKVVPVGMRKKALEVYSVTCDKDKVLPSDSVGAFTTDPRLTYMYLSEITDHLLSHLPLDVQVVMSDRDISTEIPYYLTKETATITHVGSETSLIASTNWGKNEQVSEEDQMPVEIPVDLPIAVLVQQPDDKKEVDLSENTKRLYERFDPCQVRSLRARHIRRGFEKEGMELQRPERIYDLPDICLAEHSPSQQQISTTRSGTAPPLLKSKSRSMQTVSPQLRNKPATPTQSLDNTYQPLVLHTQLQAKTQYAIPVAQRQASPKRSPQAAPTPASGSSCPVDVGVLVARVEILEREVYALRSEIAKLRAQGELHWTHRKLDKEDTSASPYQDTFCMLLYVYNVIPQYLDQKGSTIQSS